MASDVWAHFVRATDKKSATCKLCDATLAYSGGTSNLRNHLRNKHPAAEKKSAQPTMSTFISTPKKTTSSEAEKITQAITNMVVLDYVPLNIVEGEGFRSLLETLAPDYKIPSRNTIRSRVEKRYSEEKEQLIRHLSKINSAAITTDTWTSNSTESFITVTEHHIDDDWELQANVLLTRPMPERHTGENLAKRLKESVGEFNLDKKVETCVHDNARNMECAGSKCDDWNDLGCFGHTLQLCVKPALELGSVSHVLAKCRKLVGHFKHSTTLTAELGKRQHLLGAAKHSLVQDVATRWNSSQKMLERLVEQRRVVTDIMLDSTVTKKADSGLLLKDFEWETASEVSDVLKVFDDVTAYMCAERDVSVSDIYPIVTGLLDTCLDCRDTDSSVVVEVKETIAGELTERYRPTSGDSARSVPALASLLDPRYKTLPFFTARQRRSTEEHLESRLDDLPLSLASRDDSSTESQPKRRKLDFLVYSSRTHNSDDELQRYLVEQVDCDARPLDWWKTNEKRFPRIAKIAKSVLAVPATSVPSERIFSHAGLILNKLRNRLSGEIVDNIIFLNKNR